MKITVCFTAVMVAASSILSAAATIPTYEKVRASLKKNHPRLFISKDDLPKFRARANGVCKEYLQ
ncbi:MAG: hypothetical protein IKD46_02855, partial [Lentisphaeria bacterium]|nr:hypothetical protein [Lentisphaeria bacterium]